MWRQYKQVNQTATAAVSSAKSVAYDLAYSLSERICAIIGSEEWLSYEGAQLYAYNTDYVALKIRFNGVYEPDVARAIREYTEAGDTVIDAGAHIGHHGITMRQSVGADGDVLLFEPNPTNARYIEKTITQNGWENVELHQTALSDTASAGTLIATSERNTGKAALESANTDEATAAPDSQIAVETRPLTEILDERGIERVGLLKIDIEGAETEVIRDLAGELDRVETIILETHAFKLPDHEIEALYHVLDESGELSTIEGEEASLDAILNTRQTLVWHHDRPERSQPAETRPTLGE